ncbi:MAG: T9SS type A sorting domain-containing protein [Bacteroidota bacterium]
MSKIKSIPSKANSINDLTPPTTPQNLRVVTESMHSIMAFWDSASDPESGISGYAFAIGSDSNGANLNGWQSTGTAINVGGISPYALGLREGDTFYFSVFAVNGAGLQSPIVSSGPVVLHWEDLGNINNEISIAFSNGWNQGEKDSIGMFLTRMLPIIKNIYGPPSHSYTVSLVKDSNYNNTNVFFSGTDEVHMLRMYPQLLTHELIHAFRDNVVLSSDSLWRYDATLSGFEESFAQGVSYACMNEYVKEYPNGPIVTSASNFGSFYDFDYDFQNTDRLTTTDLWSDNGGMQLNWLRYEMGAAAIHKIMMDCPNFPINFNTLYYQRLNADHSLRLSKDLIKDLISTVAPSIEGSGAKDWIDKQHIFDCRVKTGHKIWVSTQHYDDWDQQYLIFQNIFYYETFSNGSEWAYWDTVTSQYVYYSSNGSVGSGTLKDWNGNTIWQKNLTITPVDNPPVWYGFGLAIANMTTGSDNQPWPGGDINNFILNLHDFGLYSLQFTFGNTTTTVPRIIGDTLRGTKGVYGAILNTVNGQLYVDHENFTQEAPLTVTNGVFYGKRSWTSIPNSNTGGTDSKPGRVYIKYIEDGGRVYYDQRNIDLGSYAGNQLFLFDTKSMKLDSPLSIELGSFTASVLDKSVDVHWTTKTETNTYRFEVEHQLANICDQIAGADTSKSEWIDVGFISGAGTSNVPITYSLTERNLSAGSYNYRLKQIDRDGSFNYSQSIKVEVGGSPKTFELSQNFPNPFNPTTIINYQLPMNSLVTLKIYDILGREVAILTNGRQNAGYYSATFDGSNLPSGVYFYKLEAGTYSKTKKLLLLK